MEISAVANAVTDRVFLPEVDESQELTNQVARIIFSNYPAAEHSQKTINAAVKSSPNLVGVARKLFR